MLKYILIFILLSNITIAEELYMAEIISDNEIIINEAPISDNIIYESSDSKSKRYAPYALCFVLMLIIIAIKVEKNERTRSNCTNHSRSSRLSKRVR